MDDAIQRSAEHMVRAMWRKEIPRLVNKLCKEEGVGFTQASAYIARAIQPFVDAAEEPWERAVRTHAEWEADEREYGY